MNILRKTSRPFAGGTVSDSGLQAVVLEPKEGYSPAELEVEARACQAQQMERLTDRMFSALLDHDGIRRLSSVAHVRVKPVKVLH